MKYRKLRIAWSVVWGVVAVLLTAVWIRSFATFDVQRVLGNEITIGAGSALINETWVEELTVISDDGAETTMIPAGTGLTIPLWLPTAAISLLAAAPWIFCRFSLRTLLIATTLVAVGLGAIIRAAR